MEVSFKDILRILKKNILFIIIISVAFAMFSFLFTKLFIPKKYSSSVKMYVSTEYKDTSSGYEDLNRYTYSSKLVATYIQILDTNSFREEVSKTLNGKYTPAQLDASISFNSAENTEVFETVVVSEDPLQAKEICDAIQAVAPKTVEDVLDNSSKLKIVDPAVVAKAPFAPNVASNTIMAFLIGLVLSIIFAFVRDYFDVKIKYNEEMTTIAGVPVLAAIPDFEYFANNVKDNAKNGNA